jgi:hypothetical protein
MLKEASVESRKLLSECGDGLELWNYPAAIAFSKILEGQDTSFCMYSFRIETPRVLV